MSAGLDPNMILQMIMSDMQRRQAGQRAESRDLADEERRRKAKFFELGLQSAKDPNQDTDALLNYFNLPSQEDALIRSIDKTTKKQAKDAERLLQTVGGSGARAAADPVAGGGGLFETAGTAGRQPTLEEVMASRRAIITGITGRPVDFPPEGEQGDVLPQTEDERRDITRAFSAVDVNAQKRVADERTRLLAEQNRNLRAQAGPQAEREIDKFARMATRRAEVRAFADEFTKSRAAAAEMKALSEIDPPTGIADMNLALAAAKIRDPRITQKDLEAQLNAGAWGEQLQSWFQRGLKGPMPNFQRDRLIQQARASFEAKEKEHIRQIKVYNDTLRRENLSPEDVTYLFEPPPLFRKSKAKAPVEVPGATVEGYIEE